MQGIRPGDVVLNSWLYGTHNGAWVFDEALYRWLNCVVLTASAGSVMTARKGLARRTSEPLDDGAGAEAAAAAHA